MSADLDTIAVSVQELQKDMAQVGLLVGRIDITIEKLTEVSATVSQLLAVQGNRLEMQEKVQDKLVDLVEKRKAETDDAINKAYIRMERIEEKLQTDIKSNTDRITNTATKITDEFAESFDELKEEIKANHTATDVRIAAVEKWMWGIAGGTSALMVLITILNSFGVIGS